jgi:hypothetical protein
VLEPLAPSAAAEIVSPTSAAQLPGYDALNKCWLASALLVIRGFARHLCPAVSAYSTALDVVSYYHICGRLIPHA